MTLVLRGVRPLDGDPVERRGGGDSLRSRRRRDARSWVGGALQAPIRRLRVLRVGLREGRLDQRALLLGAGRRLPLFGRSRAAREKNGGKDKLEEA